MRKIYLIQHGKPDLPSGEQWCLGRTDVPLGVLGRMQAQILRHIPELQSVKTVFASPLRRARETARILSEEIQVIPDLQERDMGEWDGLCFSDIRRKWPDLYEVRKRWPDILPDGAETMEHVKERVERAVRSCLSNSEGDILIVTHRGAIASLVGSRQTVGYGTVTLLGVEEGKIHSMEVGRVYHPELTDELCHDLMVSSGVGRVMEEHGATVAFLADHFVEMLSLRGARLSGKEIHQACLLHDIARRYANHATQGASWMQTLGYPQVADLIRQHHQPDIPGIHDASIVFVADKCVTGNWVVGLEDRLFESERYRRNPEAMREHMEKRRMAEVVANQMNYLCQDRLVP